MDSTVCENGMENTGVDTGKGFEPGLVSIKDLETLFLLERDISASFLLKSDFKNAF